MTDAEVQAKRTLADAAELAKAACLTVAKADDVFEVLSRVNDVQASKLRLQLRQALMAHMTNLRGVSLALSKLAKGEADAAAEVKP